MESFDIKQQYCEMKWKLKCAHHLIVLYEQEADRQYCKKGMDLEGVSYSKCKKKFGLPGMPPTIT